MLKSITESEEYKLIKLSSIKHTFESVLTKESIERMNEEIKKYNDLCTLRYFKASLISKKQKCLSIYKKINY